jgi:O-acetyl-ADP-ribose deacetylase (regulator of RNase III)
LHDRVTSSPSHSEQTRSYRFGRTTLAVQVGDLALAQAAALVIPANRRGMMVAGVAGHVRLRGGVEIERQLMQMAPLTLGTSVATGSGDLEALQGTTTVMHAVVFDDLGGSTRLDIVERALESMMESADRNRVTSIAVPPIGAGIGEGRLARSDVFALLVGVVAAHLRRYVSRIGRVEIICADEREAREVLALIHEAHTLWWQMKTTASGD